MGPKPICIDFIPPLWYHTSALKPARGGPLINVASPHGAHPLTLTDPGRHHCYHLEKLLVNGLSRVKNKIARSPFLMVSGFYLLVSLILLSGIPDSFVPNGTVNKIIASGSILLYWLYTYVAVKIILGWRMHRKDILITVGSVLLILIAAEVAIRIFHPADALQEFAMWYSPAYHHVNPPSREMYQGFDKAVGSPILVSTNEDGFRTAYSREQFLEYGTRIVMLGDSFIFGVNVRQEIALPQVAESVLRARLGQRDLAVLNAGGVSWSPLLEKLLFDEVLEAYRPTHLLLFIDTTDIGDDYEYATIMQQNAGARRFPRVGYSLILDSGPNLSDHSALLQRLQWPLAVIKSLTFHPFAMARSDRNPLSIPDVHIDGHVENNRFFIYRYPLEKTMPYFERMFDNITAISKSATSIGASFVLVVLPRYHHWNPLESPRNWEGPGLLHFYTGHEPFQYEYFRFFEIKRDQVDFPILNLLPAFQASDEFPLVFENDPHWNASGHRLAANAVVDFLIEAGLVR
jgi:hypothetical protein